MRLAHAFFNGLVTSAAWRNGPHELTAFVEKLQRRIVSLHEQTPVGLAVVADQGEVVRSQSVGRSLNTFAIAQRNHILLWNRWPSDHQYCRAYQQDNSKHFPAAQLTFQRIESRV